MGGRHVGLARFYPAFTASLGAYDRADRLAALKLPSDLWEKKESRVSGCPPGEGLPGDLWACAWPTFRPALPKLKRSGKVGRPGGDGDRLPIYLTRPPQTFFSVLRRDKRRAKRGKKNTRIFDNWDYQINSLRFAPRRLSDGRIKLTVGAYRAILEKSKAAYGSPFTVPG